MVIVMVHIEQGAIFVTGDDTGLRISPSGCVKPGRVKLRN